MSDNRKHSAGKGDKYRPVNIKKFTENYDYINWKSKEKKIDKKENK